VIEVPLDLPLDVRLPDEEAAADEILDNSAALVEGYGVRAVVRLTRARAAGPAIAEEADRRNAELIVLGAPRARIGRGRIFGRTVDYVLKHSPSRVMIAAGRRVA
jgi:basic amino acid/polyamine antiporter, APA family